MHRPGRQDRGPRSPVDFHFMHLRLRLSSVLRRVPQIILHHAGEEGKAREYLEFLEDVDLPASAVPYSYYYAELVTGQTHDTEACNERRRGLGLSGRGRATVTARSAAYGGREQGH